MLQKLHWKKKVVEMLTMNADASPQGTADHLVGVSSQTLAHNPLLSNVNLGDLSPIP